MKMVHVNCGKMSFIRMDRKMQGGKIVKASHSISQEALLIIDSAFSGCQTYIIFDSWEKLWLESVTVHCIQVCYECERV